MTTPNDVRPTPGPAEVRVHEMKSDARVFPRVLSGAKRHEARMNPDGGILVGHFLHLREWSPLDGGTYTGREVFVLVTHMDRVEGRGEFGEFDVVLSFRPLAVTVPMCQMFVPWSANR